ncbi:unnamed protein product, partial [Polarella glacialis]
VCLTDGSQVVCGIERKPIAALRQARPGQKLVLGNRPLLRRGLLLLEPQHLEVLGQASVSPALAAIQPSTNQRALPPAPAAIQPSLVQRAG